MYIVIARLLSCNRDEENDVGQFVNLDHVACYCDREERGLARVLDI